MSEIHCEEDQGYLRANFCLREPVEIIISGERGQVTAIQFSCDSDTRYQIHFRTSDGRAAHKWFFESRLRRVGG